MTAALNDLEAQIRVICVGNSALQLEFCCLIAGDGFSFEGGQLYCKDCFVTNSGIKCNGCGQGVSPDDLWIEALDVTWHSQCFVCDVSIG